MSRRPKGPELPEGPELTDGPELPVGPSTASGPLGPGGLFFWIFTFGQEQENLLQFSISLSELGVSCSTCFHV